MAVARPTAARIGADGEAPREVSGPARPGRKTKLLVKRLHRGDIAVIDHKDLDRVSAEDLIAAGVAAVLNCRPSSTGAYPNMGPLLLVQAGVHLVDMPGDALFKELDDGDEITVRGGEVIRRGKVVAKGSVQEPEDVRARQRASAGARSATRWSRSRATRSSTWSRSASCWRASSSCPRFDTDFRDRPALVVVRGVDHRKDLRALRPYIRDVRPALVGVDGGANALLEEGFTPDMIVGDMDSAQEATLRCGAELVVHAYPDGRAPGREHLEALGLSYKLVPAPGTSQDVAMLIAAEKGAAADRLGRLAVEPGRVPGQEPARHVVDVPHPPADRRDPRRRQGREPPVPAAARRPRRSALVLLVGIVALAAVIAVTPGLRDVADLLWLKLQVLLGIDA